MVDQIHNPVVGLGNVLGQFHCGFYYPTGRYRFFDLAPVFFPEYSMGMKIVDFQSYAVSQEMTNLTLATSLVKKVTLPGFRVSAGSRKL